MRQTIQNSVGDEFRVRVRLTTCQRKRRSRHLAAPSTYSDEGEDFDNTMYNEYVYAHTHKFLFFVVAK